MSAAPADRFDPAVISVIVPCFDTAAYLDECLTSIVGQSYPRLEIITIDDGSTDGTSAQLDEWRDREQRLTVIHQPNRGLGAARNSGLAVASGEYLTFVDSDDILPRDALERMVTTIERTGSDFVSGVADRFDGDERWRASLYRRGFREDLERTHVFERPSLLNDHIVCSKLFRRSFWDEHDLRFPEGSLFEDIEIATRAHCLAETVDLLVEPTYLWRDRPDGDVSITQDRIRPGSVTQRFGALTGADHFIRDHAPPNVWRRHGLKVISIDIPLYLREVDGADDEFVEEYISAAADFLGTASPRAVDEQGHLPTRLIEMLRAGDLKGVRAMSRLMGHRKTRTIRSRLSGVTMLTWRDRFWLVGVAGQTASSRIWGLVRSAAWRREET